MSKLFVSGSGLDRADAAKVDVGAASEVEPGERSAGAQRRHTHHAPTTSEIQMRQLTANAEGRPRVRVRVTIIVQSGSWFDVFLSSFNIM